MLLSIVASFIAAEGPSITDNEWLDQFRIPFGDWLKQIVFWTTQNLQGTLAVIEWPFASMFDLIMSNNPNRTSIMSIPWIWVVIGFFLLASFTRNVRIGLMLAVMLAMCGLLGPEYWNETAKTIGMIFVSVLLCTIIGVPLGVVCGRFDSMWNVVRPALDAMQVVHPFVYMLPFIFFFGIGEVSATMVTMVFALPPIVRLTNLGIRQVPEDVVEASRAYGATELRVLTDVQLPLARPAIMTGLNQTLLLAFSMLGIAALMGAGGLGKLLFRAINNLNLGLAASAGMAFFFVAVVLDRLSQTEDDDGLSLLGRIREAHELRREPEALLAAKAERIEAATLEAETNNHEGHDAPVGSRERLGLLVGATGAVLAVASVFLEWGNDAGLVSSWARRVDIALDASAGQQGWAASGGSFFGLVVFGLGFLAVLAALRPMLSFPDSISHGLARVHGYLLITLASIIVLIWVLNMAGVDLGPIPTIGLTTFGVLVFLIGVDTFIRGTPRLGSDGLLISGLGVFGSAFGYLLLQPSVHVLSYSHGVGVYVALGAGAIMTVGGIIAISSAQYGPLRPLPVTTSWGRVVGVGAGILLVVGGSFSGWIFDERIESLITPEIQAQLDQLEADAGNDVTKQLVAAQEITNILNALQTQDRIVHQGVNEDGPGLGFPAIGLAALALLAVAPAAGLLGSGEDRRWQGSVLLAGLGMGIMAIAVSWIGSLVRISEARVVSGAGAFFVFVGGFIIFATGRAVVGEFRRRKVWGDPITGEEASIEDVLLHVAEAAAESEPVGAGAS